MSECPPKRSILCSFNNYFQGTAIRKISPYLDRKPQGALFVLQALKSFIQLTTKERKLLMFHSFNFEFRVLQFLAMNQEEVIGRTECFGKFLNFEGRKMVKLELRFSREVISSGMMDDINQMFQCLLGTRQLGQMDFSQLQV